VRKRLLVVAALTLATGSIAAGCGGGDEDGETTPTAAALSKEEFLKQGNQICAASEKQIDAEAQKVFGNQQPSQSEVESFATKTAIPTLQFEIAGIEALPAPSGDEDQVNAIVSAAQQGLDELKADPSLITAEGQDDPFAEAKRLAKQYGLTACA
jgi:hypothetical protein